MRLGGASDEYIDNYNSALDKANKFLFENIDDPDKLEAEIYDVIKGTPLEGAEKEILSLRDNKELLGLLMFRPEKYYPHIKCPVLALNGEKDVQVTYRENLDGIFNGLSSSGNKNVKIISYPGLNHLFQTAGTGNFDEYKKIEETFNIKVLEDMAEWITDLK
ncbi:MAG: dienelactone hydrolase family protein [Rikenellaceae bacterium]|nr:dienelactone hydrolase family protein [Rikenellaceae bacterium]